MQSDRDVEQWRRLKRQIKRKWRMLTDHQLDPFKSDQDGLAGLVEYAYGVPLEDARRQLEEFQFGSDGAISTVDGRDPSQVLR
ncbi:MAG: CsbD family protein [Gemmatimonadales bacterium]